MAQAILHIGTHKTATTSLQDLFWSNSARLEEHGLIYPRLSTHTGHHGLVEGWTGMPEIYRLPSDPLETLRSLAAAHAGRGPDTTLFLSSEEFSRNEALDHLGALRDALSGFDRVRVFCTLRTQWRFLQSLYLELSKHQSPPRPQALVGAAMETGLCQGLWIDYLGLLDRLETVFDPEDITLFDFDTACHAPGGLPQAMLSAAGLADINLHEVPASNISPLPLASWGANLLSEPRPAPSWLVTKMTEVVQAKYGPKIRTSVFSREELARLNDHFDAGNLVLEARRAPLQPDFALTRAAGSGVALARGEVSADFWLEAGRHLVSGYMGG
ncbi:hypothetical protein [Jannaschia sp. M317]|uniref:hypothetical protein n=1 Tax=Jannaschia sp. M317 TaxID=2867011 RepID=UPI0021A7C96B|nr:hypothetical protein [Jannaschia sp. M317]UWQ19678.1 hypothetical protein K3551_18170 [Jannaschia sp. M317]